MEISQALYNFTCNFKSVAACRLEPLQKAELVEMTQTLAKGEITLAIGDGANDVPMIQAAHVGVGIQVGGGTGVATLIIIINKTASIRVRP